MLRPPTPPSQANAWTSFSNSKRLRRAGGSASILKGLCPCRPRYAQLPTPKRLDKSRAVSAALGCLTPSASFLGSLPCYTQGKCSQARRLVIAWVVVRCWARSAGIGLHGVWSGLGVQCSGECWQPVTNRLGDFHQVVTTLRSTSGTVHGGRPIDHKKGQIKIP